MVVRELINNDKAYGVGNVSPSRLSPGNRHAIALCSGASRGQDLHMVGGGVQWYTMSSRRAGRAMRHDDGIKPPSVRTYGSKRAWQNDRREHTTVESTTGNHSNSYARARVGESFGRVSSLGGGLKRGRPNTDHDQPYHEIIALSAPRNGSRFRSKGDEMAHWVREAAAGGEPGRASAIALAKACKSIDMRKAVLTHGGILGALMSALLMSLQGGGDGVAGAVSVGCGSFRDEALVHCLAVAMFILSKDADVAKGFSSDVVSTLALLIEGRQQCASVAKGVEKAGTDPCERSLGASREVVSLARVARKKHLWRDDESSSFSSAATSTKTAAGRRWRGTGPPPRPDACKERHASFALDDEDDEDLIAVHGNVSTDGSDQDKGILTANQRYHSVNGVDSGSNLRRTSALVPTYSTKTDRGSADVLVRARMLLDISDVIPWGMANRHLVSAADLGLATLLNVAAQACPDGGDSGSGGDSMGEEFSTQESTTSQSDPSGVMGALTNGVVDGVTAASNTDVTEELSRLGPGGFLSTIVLDGVAILTSLSSSRRTGDSGSGGGGGGTDPSSLREVHRLLLGLRLLDLATLDSSANGAKGAGATAAASVMDTVHPSRNLELIRAILLIVARCEDLVGNVDLPKSNRYSIAATRRRGSVRQYRQRSAHSLGDEMTSRVHECLLAALRVLINVTHHNPHACADVAARGGLDTLMTCLVNHSHHTASRLGEDSEGGSDAALETRDSAGFVSIVTECGADDIPGDCLSGAKYYVRHGGRSGKNGTGGGEFDAKILALGALINCVELKESADNCATMATLRVCPPSYAFSGTLLEPGVTRTATGLSSSNCFAPEFLARLLVNCTRSFALHLETDSQDDESIEDPAPPEADAGGGDALRRGIEGGGDSCTLTVTHAAGPGSATPATVMTSEGAGEGEELMTPAEGAELVLAGHCALLLGLLIREHESNRQLALSLLPDRSPTLIVRVLEAFMALQWQVGVLTEEVVLSVQGLVEELEGMEKLSDEEWNPFALDDEEDAAPSPALSLTSSPRRKARKRPRSPIKLTPARPVVTTPESGQWANDFAVDEEDEFALSVPRFRRKLETQENGSPWRALQTSEPRTLSLSSGEVAPSTPSRPSPPRRWYASSPSSPDQTAAEPKSNNAVKGGVDSRLTSCTAVAIQSQSPSTLPRAERRSSGLRFRLGLRGGSGAAGTRSWLAGASRPRTYGKASWRKPLRTLGSSGVHSPIYAVGLGGTTKTAGRSDGVDTFKVSRNRVLDLVEDMCASGKSREETRGVGDGGDGGLGPNVGRRYLTGAATSSSIFDLDSQSDASDETEEEISLQQEGRRRRPQQEQRSIISASGMCGVEPPASSSQMAQERSSRASALVRSSGGGVDLANSESITMPPRPDGRRTCSPSPSSVSPGVAQAFRGLGPRSGGGSSGGIGPDDRRGRFSSPLPPRTGVASAVRGFGPRGGCSSSGSGDAVEANLRGGRARQPTTRKYSATSVQHAGNARKGADAVSRATLLVGRVYGVQRSRSPSSSVPELGAGGKPLPSNGGGGSNRYRSIDCGLRKPSEVFSKQAVMPSNVFELSDDSD